MSGTPRLRSAFPSTPQSTQGNRNYGRPQNISNGTNASSKPSALPQQVPDTPLIPFELIDAPSQRLLVIGFYGLLTAWRFYDFSTLLFGQADSVWLFMKWVAMDGVFLFGLPALRVPWMEWSSTTMTFVFLMHAIVDSFMIFGIPVSATYIVCGIRMILIRTDPCNGIFGCTLARDILQRDCGLRETRETSEDSPQLLPYTWKEDRTHFTGRVCANTTLLERATAHHIVDPLYSTLTALHSVSIIHGLTLIYLSVSIRHFQF